jgi:hypothetical protein
MATPEPTWQSPPGTVKKVCPGCDEWFSSRDGARRCGDCRAIERRPGRPSLSPLDPGAGFGGFQRSAKRTSKP